MYKLIKLLSQVLKNKAIRLGTVVGRPDRSPLRWPSRRHCNHKIDEGRTAPKFTNQSPPRPINAFHKRRKKMYRYISKQKRRWNERRKEQSSIKPKQTSNLFHLWSTNRKYTTTIKPNIYIYLSSNPISKPPSRSTQHKTLERVFVWYSRKGSDFLANIDCWLCSVIKIRKKGRVCDVCVAANHGCVFLWGKLGQEWGNLGFVNVFISPNIWVIYRFGC